jgi:mannose-6-phosphate isomerase
MAASDNVIRAGLTPKLRDIPNLISGLTYEPSEATKHVVKPVAFNSSNERTLLFDPPVSEFSVLQVKVGNDESEIHRAINGPSIAVVTDGRGKASWQGGEMGLSVGQVIFIGAGTEISFTTERGIVIYRAYVEV